MWEAFGGSQESVIVDPHVCRGWCFTEHLESTYLCEHWGSCG